MSDHRLLRTQMNEVLLAIKEAGMEPLEFKFSEETYSQSDGMGALGVVQRNLYHRLVHEPSGYECVFEATRLSYSPGWTTRHTAEGSSEWRMKLVALSSWLKNLKREISAPDLWGSLADERALLNSFEPSADDNTPFTETEQRQIKLGIEELRAHISKTQPLNEEDAGKINVKLDYLISASEQLGRIHWKDIFVSTLLAIAWQLALPAPGFHNLFSFAGQILRQILGTVISPPMLH